MRLAALLHARGPFIDVGHSSMKVLLGDRGLEVPLERSQSGELTVACRTQIVEEVRGFVGSRRRSLRPVLCALPARGITLRRFLMPATSPGETRQMLALQLEREFPLPLNELSWGYEVAPGEGTDGIGLAASESRNEVTVIALRRQVIDEYRGLLLECGLRPTFVLGILATSRLFPTTKGRSCVLDIGRTHSELVVLEDGRPIVVRSISWGGELRHATSELSKHLDAALVGGHFSGNSRVGNSQKPASPPRLYLTGGGARLPGLRRDIEELLGDHVSCEALQVKVAVGHSPVTVGLRTAKGGDIALRFLPPEKLRAWTPSERPASRWRWLAAASVLAVACLTLRYGIPLWRASGLEQSQTLASLKKRRVALPAVDRELSFLENLEKSQLPYLEALKTIAEAVPKGTQVTTLSMTRQGDLHLKGTTGMSRQAMDDFRSKLDQSKWLLRTSIPDEQPTKDGKRLQFQLRAIFGSPAPGAPLGTAAEAPKADDAKDEKQTGAAPGKKPEKPVTVESTPGSVEPLKPSAIPPL